MSKKVLLLVGDYGEDYEIMVPFQAIIDGNLVSAPAWPAHPEWLAKFFQVMGTRISE